ncbi:hypothetical protein PENTCL1PPCAC_27097 [Pristionchus entomophagus]|uniref:Ribosomal protein n=1 Tax=Pristionchus entomophagus TaxID=358040 RepID=A0AAV5UE28_9BILA|nr:hypothetical protein PENTCL1PPCAC_27097 [Pristionchus entomophagus]
MTMHHLHEIQRGQSQHRGGQSHLLFCRRLQIASDTTSPLQMGLLYHSHRFERLAALARAPARGILLHVVDILQLADADAHRSIAAVTGDHVGFLGSDELASEDTGTSGCIHLEMRGWRDDAWCEGRVGTRDGLIRIVLLRGIRVVACLAVQHSIEEQLAFPFLLLNVLQIFEFVLDAVLVPTTSVKMRGIGIVLHPGNFGQIHKLGYCIHGRGLERG